MLYLTYNAELWLSPIPGGLIHESIRTLIILCKSIHSKQWRNRYFPIYTISVWPCQTAGSRIKGTGCERCRCRWTLLCLWTYSGNQRIWIPPKTGLYRSHGYSLWFLRSSGYSAYHSELWRQRPCTWNQRQNSLPENVPSSLHIKRQNSHYFRWNHHPRCRWQSRNCRDHDNDWDPQWQYYSAWSPLYCIYPGWRNRNGTSPFWYKKIWSWFCLYTWWWYRRWNPVWKL